MKWTTEEVYRFIEVLARVHGETPEQVVQDEVVLEWLLDNGYRGLIEYLNDLTTLLVVAHRVAYRLKSGRDKYGVFADPGLSHTEEPQPFSTESNPPKA